MLSGLEIVLSEFTNLVKIAWITRPLLPVVPDLIC